MNIKNPKRYYSDPDILKNTGEYVKPYTNRPVIIGGERALASSLQEVEQSLSSTGINVCSVKTFTGFPSVRQFQMYAEEIKKQEADSVIVLGGGRAIDTAKAAGALANVPVIAIPTVAATCAAWAALVIQYDDEGSYVGRILVDDSPAVVIADTKVLLSTPRRYLFSGVVDTFAKYYEIRPVFEKDPSQIHMDIAYYASKIAFQKLEENTFKALDEAEKGVFGQPAKDVVDSIIYLAGFAGAFQTHTGGYCFAHPFYHISARFPSTRFRMHGEKVAFGILVQLVLEKKDKQYIYDTIELFDRYENAFTLEDIGLDPEDDAQLFSLSADIKKVFSYVYWEQEDIISAIKEADDLAKRYKERCNVRYKDRKEL